MSIRTVRLDDEAESTLAALQKQTGLSMSKIFKLGLEAYATVARDNATKTPYEVYRRLDPGQGGEAVGPASNAKELVVETIRKKYRR